MSKGTQDKKYDSGEYEVERVVGKSSDGTKYIVKWAGYRENSTIDISHLNCPFLIVEYEASIRPEFQSLFQECATPISDLEIKGKSSVLIKWFNGLYDLLRLPETVVKELSEMIKADPISQMKQCLLPPSGKHDSSVLIALVDMSLMQFYSMQPSPTHLPLINIKESFCQALDSLEVGVVYGNEFALYPTMAMTLLAIKDALNSTWKLHIGYSVTGRFIEDLVIVTLNDIPILSVELKRAVNTRLDQTKLSDITETLMYGRYIMEKKKRSSLICCLSDGHIWHFFLCKNAERNLIIQKYWLVSADKDKVYMREIADILRLAETLE